MKEVEINGYYSDKAKELLSKSDYNREMDRLAAEKAARAKYLADEEIKAELARKEAAKKQFEEASRIKEANDRKARLDARKQVLVDEAKERQHIKEQRENAIANFDNLNTADMLSVLNDGDDMHIYFKDLYNKGYEKFTSDPDMRRDMDDLPGIKKNMSEEELHKADVIFQVLFSDIADLERPFLVALNGDKVPQNPEKRDGMIVGNFVIDSLSINDHLRGEYGIDTEDPDTLARYQKCYIINTIVRSYKDIEEDYKDAVTVNTATIRQETEKASEGKSDKEIEAIKASAQARLLEENEKSKAKILDKQTSIIQYKGFVAEKNPDGSMDIIRPVEDYSKGNRNRKAWLDKNPEKTDVTYIKDDLDYQLGLIKKAAGFAARDQKVPESIYGENTKERIPASLNRTKYELRELRAAFEMQAEKVSDGYLKDFNRNMAVLANYEAGDFRRLMREKPHIAHLLDAVLNGPFCRPVEGKTQDELYKELEAHDRDTLRAYMRFAISVTNQVAFEYSKQKLAANNYPAEEEAELKDDIVSGSNGLYFSIDDLKKADLSYFDQFCTKPLSEAFKTGSPANIESDANVIKDEISALQNGWKMKETTIFAIIDRVYKNASALDDKDHQKYGKIFNALSKLSRNIREADSAVEKRSCLTKFENIIRDNIDDKELVGVLETYQTEYDSVRESFEAGYKQSVLDELKELKNAPARLAQEMIEMQRVALVNDEPFHDDIFKEFINSLDAGLQQKLQVAMFNERLDLMLKRAQTVNKYTDEATGRTELDEFKHTPVIYNDILAQIGALISKNDGVTAADRLFTHFKNPISEKEKENLRNVYKEKNISKDSKNKGEVNKHDPVYLNMQLAERIENNKADHGIKVVTAPDGGFNINYEKDIIEIRKDLLEKTDAQFSDLKIELAKIKTTMAGFLTSETGLRLFSPSNELRNAVTQLATAVDNITIDGWIQLLESIDNRMPRELASSKYDDDELKLLHEIDTFTKKSLALITPEHYPDVRFKAVIRDINWQIETTKVLWESRAEGNKFEPKPTEFIKNKQEEDKKDKNYKVYEAIAKVSSRKNLDMDAEYKHLALTPSVLIELCEKYFGALQALDGDNISKESEEYQNFYYSLKDLKENPDIRAVDPNDGSNITMDCVADLDKSITKYLASNDNSKNAELRKNIAYQIRKTYLHTTYQNDNHDYVEDLNNFVKKDWHINNKISNLSDAAKQKRTDRENAEKKAIEDKEKTEKLNQENRTKLNNELTNINIEKINLEEHIKKQNQIIKDETRQIGITKGNLKNNPNAGVGRIEQWNNMLVESNKKINDAQKKISDFQKSINSLDKRKDDAKKLYAEKEIIEVNVLKRQAVKDKMKKDAQKAPAKKDVKKKDAVKTKVKNEPKKKTTKKTEVINDDNLLTIKNTDNLDVINTDAHVNPVAGKKADIIAPAAPKLKKGYEKYMLDHTGKKAGKDHDTKVDNFAKIIAAYSLKANKIKFSVSTIHDYMDVMKDNFCLSDLSDEDLDKYLASPNDAIKGGDSIRSAMYGIKEADYNNFCDEMKKLYDTMMDPKNRSFEYKDMARCIKKAADLKDKQFASPEDKYRSFAQASFLVTFTATKYTKGKKSIRSSSDGNERFRNSLDALAIVSKYSNDATRRIDKLIDRINKFRDNENKVDKNTFTDVYGAKRAEEAATARAPKNAPKNITK